MAIHPFLAMTAAEIRTVSDFPPKIAWMACHFSPYCTGLSNLPRELPPGSLLILDDITPIHGHDPEEIGGQLTERVEKLECSGVLLDFQRPDCEETAALAKHLAGTLPCPVGVSEPYAGELDCPVFLPPAPPDVPLVEYIAPWSGREVWLEMALDGEVISLTEQGAETAPLPWGETFAGGFAQERLHCHYRIETDDNSARFTLWRTREDLEGLLEDAEKFGVTTAVGLYQELHGFAPQSLPLKGKAASRRADG